MGKQDLAFGRAALPVFLRLERGKTVCVQIARGKTVCVQITRGKRVCPDSQR